MDSLDRNTENNGWSELAKNYLINCAKWGKFLAIIGFIGVGFMVLGALFMVGIGSAPFGAGNIVGGVGAVMYLIMAAVYFFPCLYLYQFSTNMKAGIEANDQAQVESGLKNLEQMFRFVGILTIVFLSIYVLMIIIGIGAGAMTAARF